MAIKQNTKAFADLVVSNPKMHANEAYLATHKTNNRKAAAVAASQLLKKPEVQIYMDKHVQKAKKKIVTLVDSPREEIALKASESILDRNLGKPITRSNNVNLDINLEDLLSNLT